MSEVDDLRASLYDLDDERTCLEADLAVAENDRIRITAELVDIDSQIVAALSNIQELERTGNE